MRAFAITAPQLPHFAQVQTFSAHRVWKDSARSEIKFAALPKRQAVRIFHDARRFERQTAVSRIDAYGRRTTQGKIGRMGILVLHSLLFDFLNYSSGRLDPSYQAIAASACVSIRSVARALVKLKAAGVLNWVRRCSASLVDGCYTLEQDTNAYGVTPSTQWPGYFTPPPAPAPHPEAWGASQPVYAGMVAAAEETRHGQHAAAVRAWEAEGDPLGLAGLARRRLGGQKP